MYGHSTILPNVYVILFFLVCNRMPYRRERIYSSRPTMQYIIWCFSRSRMSLYLVCCSLLVGTLKINQLLPCAWTWRTPSSILVEVYVDEVLHLWTTPRCVAGASTLDSYFAVDSLVCSSTLLVGDLAQVGLAEDTVLAEYASTKSASPIFVGISLLSLVYSRCFQYSP